MIDQGVDILKFSMENFGLVGTIIFLAFVTPLTVIIILARIISKLQKSLDGKLDTIENSMKEVTGLVRGTLEVVKYMLRRDIDTSPQQSERGDRRDDANDSDPN